MIAIKLKLSCRFYSTPFQNDTIYGATGRVINGYVIRTDDGEYKFDEEEYKLKNGDYKEKVEGDEAKVKTDDKKIKSDEEEKKVKNDN